jgi:hypothetical protein
MIQNTVLSQRQPSVGVTKIASRVTVGLSTLFLAILFLLHFLEPEFDPSWRMISEYALGRYGWLMTLAFFLWSGSVLALLVALGPSLNSIGGKIGRVWLLVITTALFGAGIFKTNPITESASTIAHNLHALCGAIVIMTFPIAASLVTGSLARHPEWAVARQRLLWGTLLLWFSMFAFFGSIIISRLINPSAGRVGPDVLLGWPNRFLVVIYHLWLIMVALHAALNSRQQAGKQPDA